ncbi:hypothetical protein [Roseospira marina]|nr:hypothetical protein [Roseospira marina]MBB4314561.1 chromosomal replication initiation ATPase DnaA [Roseospira marina]MBB5088877.1 chromosomal replication initiation ATPase DnaA [Roseospira marina]
MSDRPRDYLIRPRDARAATSRCADILHAVAHERGCSVAAIKGLRRTSALIAARREVVRRSTLADVSAARIGRVLDRDHTTILYHQSVLGLR